MLHMFWLLDIYSYLNLTYHYSDDEFASRSFVLATRIIKTAHTAKKTAEEIQEILDTNDCGSDVVNALKDKYTLFRTHILNNNLKIIEIFYENIID